MAPELRVLFVCDLAICLMTALALLFYRFVQRTHAGFDLWVASTVLTAAGHLVNFLRSALLPHAAAVLLSNLFYSLAAVARLEGTWLHTEDKRLPRWTWALPALVVILQACDLATTNDVAHRTFVVSALFSGTMLAVAAAFARAGPAASRPVHRLAAAHWAVFALLTAVRALYCLTASAPPFEAGGWVHSGYVLYAAVYEGMSCLLVIMITGKRVENELVEAHARQEETAARLRQALAEVRILSGFLPICAACKRVRDVRGIWNQIEAYLEQHSLVEFSRGVCPACASTLEPVRAPADPDPPPDP